MGNTCLLILCSLAGFSGVRGYFPVPYPHLRDKVYSAEWVGGRGFGLMGGKGVKQRCLCGDLGLAVCHHSILSRVNTVSGTRTQES